MFIECAPKQPRFAHGNLKITSMAWPTMTYKKGFELIPYLLLYVTKYSRTDHVKFVEDSL